MKTIRFMYQNWADTATLTYSTQNSNFPATYSKHRWPTRSWRSSSLGAPDYLKYNLLAAKAVQFIGIRFNNFTVAATVKYEANSSDSFPPTPPPGYTATITVNNVIMPHFPAATETYQWWRIPITDAANPDVYVEVGRVFIGPYWNPSINFVDEFAWDYVDPTLITESEGGQISSIQRAKFRRHSYLFKALTEADKDLFEAMFADRGRAKDLWICEDADHNPVSDVTYYVRFADEALKFVHIQGTELYELMVTFEELR